MEYRVGTCTSCEAKYKIPASFKGNKAKCKSCSGVVEVGEVQTAASEKPKAKPVPARKPAPRQAAQVEPEKKERSGPSMKDKLLAEREAGAQTEPEEAKPASRSRTRQRRAVGAAAAGAEAAATTSRSAGRRSRRRGGGDEDVEEEPKAKRDRSSEARSSRRDRGSRSEESRAGYRPTRAKRNNPMVFISILLLLGVGAFVGWKMLVSDDSTLAGSGDEQAANLNSPGESGETGTAEDAGVPLADETSGSEDAESSGDAEVSDLPDDAEILDHNEIQDEGAGSESQEETPKPPAPGPDPSSIDLSAIADYAKWSGTTDEEWEKIQGHVETMFDPDAGAAGNRSKLKLLDIGRGAMPAILNKMKTIDFSNDQGRRDGDIGQRLLMDICNGNNFGWKYTTEPKDVVFNKKVVRSWCKQWDRAAESDEYWAKLAKLDKVEESPKEEASSDDELDDLDDLDDLEDL